MEHFNKLDPKTGKYRGTGNDTVDYAKKKLAAEKKPSNGVKKVANPAV